MGVYGNVQEPLRDLECSDDAPRCNQSSCQCEGGGGGDKGCGELVGLYGADDGSDSRAFGLSRGPTARLHAHCTRKRFEVRGEPLGSVFYHGRHVRAADEVRSRRGEDD